MGRIFLLILVLLGPVLFLTSLIIMGVEVSPIPMAFVWNLMVAVDRVLSAISIFPPAVSWAIFGFVVAAMVYVASWEAHRITAQHIRTIFVVIPLVFLAATPLVCFRVELITGGKRVVGETVMTASAPIVSAGIDFVWVQPGRFRIGSLDGEAGRDEDEVAHMVTISTGFWMSRAEITQEQWMHVMEKNPSKFQDPALPVQGVTWDEVQEFLKRMNKLEMGLFRLPTEAEWEYACRAGTTTAYHFGDDAAQLGEYAWYDANSGQKPHATGELKENPLSLFDMHGNMWEWCSDWYGAFDDSRATDPHGPAAGRNHLLRGGGWKSPAADCRAARRLVRVDGYFDDTSDIGLRLVREERAVVVAPAGGIEGEGQGTAGATGNVGATGAAAPVGATGTTGAAGRVP